MTNWWKKNVFELTIVAMYMVAGIYGALIIENPESLVANVLAVVLSAVMLTSVVWSIVRIVKRGW